MLFREFANSRMPKGQRSLQTLIMCDEGGGLGSLAVKLEISKINGHSRLTWESTSKSGNVAVDSSSWVLCVVYLVKALPP